MNQLIVLVWLLLIGGTVPLVLLLRAHSTPQARVLSFAMTLSYFWCLAGVLYPAAIGPHYSDLRSGIVEVNLWLGLIMAALGLKLFTRKGLAVAVAIWLPSAWLYVRTVSFIA